MVSKLSIDIVWAQELSDELKKIYRVDSDDCSNFMITKHDDEVISIVDDYMEPEDATFTRDLAWVKELLLEVYELGKADR